MGLATGNSEPAPSTVEAAATDKEQDNYYDEECGGIHDSTPGGNQLAVSRGSSFYAIRETSTGRNGSFGAADVFSIFEGRREFLYRSTLFGKLWWQNAGTKSSRWPLGLEELSVACLLNGA